MAIKRIIGRFERKYRSCLRCGQPVDRVLRDNEVFACERCGQQHFVDVYADHIVLTVAERPDIRRRLINETAPREQRIRQTLIAKVEAKEMEATAWEEKYREWLEELAGMPEREREVEFSYMGEEMLQSVKAYLEKRTTA